MITCDGCYMDALHENDDERARCIGRRICERAYQQGRADAERDFKNSDYWNDYLAEIISKAKADAIEKLFDKAFDVDMDSSLIYIRFDKEKFGNPFFKYKVDLMKWFTEQLKEQNNE